MIRPIHDASQNNRALKVSHAAHSAAPLYTREAFRALLARQPEWKIRAALEEGNIPSSNINDAIEWLDELEQARQHRSYLS
jgi:DNA-binding IclR family transcriptional regulator